MRISQKNVYSKRSEDHQHTPPPRTQKADCRLRKSSRILKRKRFREIATARNRYFGKILTIDHCPSTEPRLGITVVRQFGSAVKRNRFKRLVREAFRLNLSTLAPLEMVVMPKRGVTNFSLSEITEELLEYVAQSKATTGR